MATAARDRDGLAWKRISGFVIEVDYDLREPMDASTAESFVDLLHESGVLVLRGQSLTMDQQKAVLGHFGRIPPTDGAGYISNVAERGGAGAYALSFHSDYSWSSDPLQCISLHAVEVVDGASSTLFCSTTQALESMPASLRRRLETATAEMIAPADEDNLERRASDMDHAPRVLTEQRPAIRPHPATGHPYLALNEQHCTRLLDLPEAEGRDILRDVFDRLYAPSNLHRHVWSRGDMVIWDNLTVQHARSQIHDVGTRVLQRVTVGRYGLDEMYPELFAAYAAA